MRSQRINEIEQYVTRNKTVTLDDLCQTFGVSKNTIRRDVEELVDRGALKKIYGGVTALTTRELLPFEERRGRNLDAKGKIAAAAAECIQDGDIIFIDSGTTTSRIIEFLRDKHDVTVLTNNLEFILSAVPLSNVNIICLSGMLSRKTLSFTGESAVRLLQTYNIRKAFMACTGFSIERGATNSSPLEYGLKSAVIQHSGSVYLLADHTKADVTALMTYCPLDQVDTLITDAQLDDKYHRFFAASGGAVVVAT